MVFGGITGLMPSEPGDLNDLRQIPSTNTSRETGDSQDMYRRTLAASWTCRAGELPPDQFIEDLFAGGAGWEAAPAGSRSGGDEYDETASISDADPRRTVQGSGLSPNPERRPKSSPSHHFRIDGRNMEDGLSEKGSLGHQFYATNKQRRWRDRRVTGEISEFDVREDLRTWEISII
jgi:hypothetical protein